MARKDLIPAADFGMAWQAAAHATMPSKHDRRLSRALNIETYNDLGVVFIGMSHDLIVVVYVPFDGRTPDALYAAANWERSEPDMFALVDDVDRVGINAARVAEKIGVKAREKGVDVFARMILTQDVSGAEPLDPSLAKHQLHIEVDGRFEGALVDIYGGKPLSWRQCFPAEDDRTLPIGGLFDLPGDVLSRLGRMGLLPRVTWSHYRTLTGSALCAKQETDRMIVEIAVAVWPEDGIDDRRAEFPTPALFQPPKNIRSDGEQLDAFVDPDDEDGDDPEVG